MVDKMVEVNPLIFRAYDIRGEVGIDLNYQTAYIIGRGIGSYITRNKDDKRVVVGCDNRESSGELKQGLIDGLVVVGCKVIDIGLSTSPMMYATVIDLGASGGINVTGSHNPIQYNGFKIVGSTAFPLSSDEIQLIGSIIINQEFLAGEGTVEIYNADLNYLKGISTLIRLQRQMRVVVDTGNGVAGKFLPKLLREIGCDVVELHCDLEGNFPNHLPNPENIESMTHIANHVVAVGAELGIATDGDGDRVGLVDEKGKIRIADEILMLLARDFLSRHPGEKVLVDVKISKSVLEDIRQNGGIPFLWKTGHSLIKMKMREDEINLGGELSGHMFVFENYLPIDDAIYASAKLLEILSHDKISIDEKLSNVRKYFATPILEVPTPDTVKFDVVQDLVKEFSKDYEVIDLDGARVDFGRGWAVIRASNTSPNLTMRFEAESMRDLNEVENTVLTVLRKYPDIDLSKFKHI